MKFEVWWKWVRAEAERQDVLHLLGDPDSHREGFEDGYSPADEVEETIYSALASM